MAKVAESFLGASLFGSEERVPCRQHGGFLLEQFQCGGGHEALFHHEAEHVFVEPLVRHDELSLIASRGAPRVLHHPFLGLAVGVESHCHERHGMAGDLLSSAGLHKLIHQLPVDKTDPSAIQPLCIGADKIPTKITP